jgi:GT2 family glycosyltransferase
VVDNAPTSDSTERLVRERFGDADAAVTYVREPTPGLAVAHNRGVASAHGEILAFTDDDVVVDQDWLAAIAEGFASGDRVGCVTGLIVPGELETRAQAVLEARGGFAKGFARRYYDLRHPSDDRLFPFSAGRLGSGANMAFSASLLRELGGFDPAIGAGTLARGGDDLLAFFRTITAGYGLVYQPDALVWHHHRRAEAALATQAFGYGTGLSAYLTSALVHEPGTLPALLRRVPRGVAHALARTRPVGQGPTVWPRRLSTLERRGLLYGPFAYARSRWHMRRTSARPRRAITARRVGR